MYLKYSIRAFLSRFTPAQHADAILLQTLECIIQSIRRCTTAQQIEAVERSIPMLLLEKFEYDRVAWLIPIIRNALHNRRMEIILEWEGKSL